MANKVNGMAFAEAIRTTRDQQQAFANLLTLTNPEHLVLGGALAALSAAQHDHLVRGGSRHSDQWAKLWRLTKD